MLQKTAVWTAVMAAFAVSAATTAKTQPIHASAPTYTVKPDLSNVANLKQFAQELTPTERKLIAKNLFVVTPTAYTQLSDIYENNEYQRPLKYPAFITTDSMAHTYHLFYDYSLRTVESTMLFAAVELLTDRMLAQAIQDARSAQGRVRDAATRNVAYFGVAKALLTNKPPRLPFPTAQALAKSDLAKIGAHAGIADVISVGSKIDFSQFIPRGHYTRTDKLKRYFKAMMWYGLVPFDANKDAQTLQAILIARALHRDSQARTKWETVYEPTVFYVGKADDLTAPQYELVSIRIFGADPPLGAFASQPNLTAFERAVASLPGPRIQTGSAGLTKGLQFRFMGQRFIADSRILQELTAPKVDGRLFPMGLDVFAALGSDRALQILKSLYKQDKNNGYGRQMDKLRAEIAKTRAATWESNLYYGWLWTLKALTAQAPAGYPSFMRRPAWLDKNLFTALGSWTELRHDTILYAKQSTSECGGDEEVKEPPLPKGYVEPNLEFWMRIQQLNQTTLKGLAKRNLLTAKLKDSFGKIDDLIDFARKISVKELTGVKLTREEYQQIARFGTELDGLFYDFAGGNLISQADLDMALVADVHTGAGDVLEEGTGHAAAIYVVVPIEGRLYLTRGATFTHYEFIHPASDRLTDEQWQQMLKEGKQPNFAAWTSGFLLPKTKKMPEQFDTGQGGC